jgi:signal transduction histidine kinase
VVLRNEGKSLLILVTDDGIGFNAENHRSGIGGPTQHFGIRGMYDRAALLGGTLSFKSETGEGVMVRLEVPRGG